MNVRLRDGLMERATTTSGRLWPFAGSPMSDWRGWILAIQPRGLNGSDGGFRSVRFRASDGKPDIQISASFERPGTIAQTSAARYMVWRHMAVPNLCRHQFYARSPSLTCCLKLKSTCQ
jgi:hypothetical protein